jgi:hypothetical protein
MNLSISSPLSPSYLNTLDIYSALIDKSATVLGFVRTGFWFTWRTHYILYFSSKREAFAYSHRLNGSPAISDLDNLVCACAACAHSNSDGDATNSLLSTVLPRLVINDKLSPVIAHKFAAKYHVPLSLPTAFHT